MCKRKLDLQEAAFVLHNGVLKEVFARDSVLVLTAYVTSRTPGFGVLNNDKQDLRTSIVT